MADFEDDASFSAMNSLWLGKAAALAYEWACRQAEIATA